MAVSFLEELEAERGGTDFDARYTKCQVRGKGERATYLCRYLLDSNILE